MKWPEVFNGYPRTIGVYASCASCGRGSWVRFGDAVYCIFCCSGLKPPEERHESGKIFTFTEDELTMLRELALARSQIKREAGVADQKIDAQRDDYAIDYIAVRAHFGVCRWLGKPFDASVRLRGSDGYLVATNPKVQVKSTLHQHGHLIFNTQDAIKGGLIVLVVPRAMSENVEAVGWVGRETFLSMCHRQSMGYGQRLSLPRGSLKPMSAWRLS